MIIVDIETTGKSPTDCSILSIGAVLLHHKKEFYAECRMRANADVSAEALEVNGFSWKERTDPTKPTEKEIVKRFIIWAVSSDEQDLTLMGQNTYCSDIEFLKEAVKRYNLHWLFGRHFVDLHSVAYAYLMKQSAVPPTLNRVSDLSLDRILQLVHLDPEPKPHNALRGARLEAEAYSRLVFGKSLKYIQRGV